MGFTKLSSKLSRTILILIKYPKLVGFTRFLSYNSLYLFFTSLICILLSPSPNPRRFPPDSHNDPELKGTTTASWNWSYPEYRSPMEYIARPANASANSSTIKPTPEFRIVTLFTNCVGFTNCVVRCVSRVGTAEVLD